MISYSRGLPVWATRSSRYSHSTLKYKGLENRKHSPCDGRQAHSMRAGSQAGSSRLEFNDNGLEPGQCGHMHTSPQARCNHVLENEEDEVTDRQKKQR